MSLRHSAGALLASVSAALFVGAAASGTTGCGAGGETTPYPDPDYVPDPDDPLDAEIGGRIYALLVSTGGSAPSSSIEIVRVAGMDHERTIDIPGTRVSAVALDRVQGVIHVADASASVLRRYDPDSGVELAPFLLPATPIDVDVSTRIFPGEDYIRSVVTTSTGVISVTELGQTRLYIVGSGGSVRGVAIAPDGASATVAVHRDTGDGELRRYAIANTGLSLAWTRPLSDPACAGGVQPDAVAYQGGIAVFAWDAGCDALFRATSSGVVSTGAIAQFASDGVRPDGSFHQLVVADYRAWVATSSGLSAVSTPLPAGLPDRVTALAESYGGTVIWMATESTSSGASLSLLDRRDDSIVAGAYTFPSGQSVRQLAFLDRPARLASGQNFNATWGSTVSFPVDAFDPDGEPVFAWLPSGPYGATLSDGVFTWPTTCRTDSSNVQVEIRLRSGLLEIEHVVTLHMYSGDCGSTTSSGGGGCSSSDDDDQQEEEDDDGGGCACACACSTSGKRARGAGVPAALLLFTTILWRRRAALRESS